MLSSFITISFKNQFKAVLLQIISQLSNKNLVNEFSKRILRMTEKKAGTTAAPVMGAGFSNECLAKTNTSLAANLSANIGALWPNYCP